MGYNTGRCRAAVLRVPGIKWGRAQVPMHISYRPTGGGVVEEVEVESLALGRYGRASTLERAWNGEAVRQTDVAT